MERKKKRDYRKRKGITLIALVITVIVLLILAGISITMLSGDNSILNRAGEARNTEAEKSIAEKVQLAYSAALLRTKGQISDENFENILDDELSKEFSNYTLEFDSKMVEIDEKEYGFDGTVKKVKVLTEEQKTNAIGQFIKWNVPYTDVFYTSYSYDQNNGWRILKIEEGEKTGKYNVQIISTGIPALLYFQIDQNPMKTSNANNKWWGTNTSIVKNYYNGMGSNNFKNSTSWKNTYSGYYAAYGLRHNFANITFVKGTASIGNSAHYNLGFYDSINGKQETLDTEVKVKEAFSDNSLVEKITGIREVEASDFKEDLGIAMPVASRVINSTSGFDDKAKGLFRLNQLSEILQGKEYNSSRYLLATPCLEDDQEYSLYVIESRSI